VVSHEQGCPLYQRWKCTFYINVEIKCNLVGRLFILFPGVLDWLIAEAPFHCSEVFFPIPIQELPLFISVYSVCFRAESIL
jgi:hypothetical protein